MNFDRFTRIARSIRPAHYKEVRFFHVTFITDKSKIISIGINKFRTHPKNVYYNGYISRENINVSSLINCHSELIAILGANIEDFSPYTFVNVRLNLQDETRLSKPCRGCEDMLRQVGFRKIYYSTDKVGQFDLIKE